MAPRYLISLAELNWWLYTTTILFDDFYDFIQLYSKARHIFKNCNIYLKSKRFCKSKFILPKAKLK